MCSLAVERPSLERSLHEVLLLTEYTHMRVYLEFKVKAHEIEQGGQFYYIYVVS